MPEPSKEQIEAAREWLERDTTFRILDTWIRDRVDIDRVEDSIAALLAEREARARADEREACAKTAESYKEGCIRSKPCERCNVSDWIAEDIREP